MPFGSTSLTARSARSAPTKCTVLAASRVRLPSEGAKEGRAQDERPALEAQAEVIADEYHKAAGAVELAPYFGGDYGDDYAGLDLAKQGEIVPSARKQFPETIKALEHVSGEDPVGATRLAFFARQGPESNAWRCCR